MAIRKIPKTEFAAAVAQIAGERKIDPKAVTDSVKSALIVAYKKDAKEQGVEIDEEGEYTVKLNPDTGEAKIFLIEGKKEKDVTPPGFGRIAAQTAKQVIIQKIREAEKEAMLEQFKNRMGSLIAGVILRVERSRIIVGIGKGEAIMPISEQVPGENYQPSVRMSFYLKEIAEDEEKRKEIIVSRADPGLITELFRREVPEVSLGSVVVEKISRQPGKRTKIAVSSSQPGVDPVGSCVGQKGVRVQKVIEEVGREKIDIIPYSNDAKQLIIAALSPAEGGEIVKIDKKKKIVTVKVPDDQLALAIGTRGENIHCASELTGYEIKVVASGEKKEEVEGEEKDKEKVEEKREKEEKEDKGKKKEKKNKEEKRGKPKKKAAKKKKKNEKKK